MLDYIMKETKNSTIFRDFYFITKNSLHLYYKDVVYFCKWYIRIIGWYYSTSYNMIKLIFEADYKGFAPK